MRRRMYGTVLRKQALNCSSAAVIYKPSLLRPPTQPTQGLSTTPSAPLNIIIIIIIQQRRNTPQLPAITAQVLSSPPATFPPLAVKRKCCGESCRELQRLYIKSCKVLQVAKFLLLSNTPKPQLIGRYDQVLQQFQVGLALLSKLFRYLGITVVKELGNYLPLSSICK